MAAIAKGAALMTAAVLLASCRVEPEGCRLGKLITEGKVEQLRSDVVSLPPSEAVCEGKSLLSIAAASRRGYESTVVLLNAGIKPGAVKDIGMTPLHVAAMWADTRQVELLLANGADPLARDAEGKRAIDLARVREDKDGVEIARILEAAEAR